MIKLTRDDLRASIMLKEDGNGSAWTLGSMYCDDYENKTFEKREMVLDLLR